MKPQIWILAIAAIIGYNGFLIHRDHQLFKAYDQTCAQSVHPNCYYAK